MTTYTLGTDLNYTNETFPPADGLGVPFILQNTVDFSAQTISSTNASTVEVLEIPANHLVLAVWIYVHTADDTFPDTDFGTNTTPSTDVDRWQNSITLGSTGYVYVGSDAVGVDNPGGANPGMITTAATTIEALMLDSGTNVAKITTFALVVDLAVWKAR